MTTITRDEQIEVQAGFNINFTMVQNEVTDSMSFAKPLDKLVYIFMVRFAFGKASAYPSIKKLAMMASVSENPVRDSIKRLIKMGLLKVEQRNKANGENDSNLYTVYDLTPEMKKNSVSDKEVYAEALKADRERKKEKRASKNLSTGTSDSEGVQNDKIGTSDSEGGSNFEGGTSDSEDKEDVFNKTLKDLEEEELYKRQLKLKNIRIQHSKTKIEDVTNFPVSVCEEIATNLVEQKEIVLFEPVINQALRDYSEYIRKGNKVHSLAKWFTKAYINAKTNMTASRVEQDEVLDTPVTTIPFYNWMEN
jgi:hypothetical protein